MTALSPISYLNDPATTEANFQTGIGNLQTFVTELLGGGAAEALTLATDAITPTKAFMVVDTEAAAATDNLANILATNHPDGRIIAVVSTNSARVITLKHLATGSGQIDLDGDVDAVLDTPDKVILLRRVETGDKWVEVMRNWGVGSVSTADIAALWTKINLRQFWCGTSTGSVNTYTATPTVAQGTIQEGDTLRFIVHAANTGASTVNGKAITKSGTTALASGDMPINSIATVIYDGTQYQLQNPAAASSSTFTGGALTSAINEAQGADIPSATTTDIGAATGNYVNITGTTTITGLGTVQAGTARTVKFAGALTLTHNATSLMLPGNANITTAAGDVATFRSLGSGNWLCSEYTKADGTALVSSGTGGSAFKNLLRGGDFSKNPWLYFGGNATSYAAIPNGKQTATPWYYMTTGTAAVHTVAKTADAPTYAQAGYYTAHCYDLQLTTSVGSVAAGDSCYFGQIIYGSEAAALQLGTASAKSFTLTFWVKATTTGTYCVAFTNSASSRSYVAEYTVSASNTWEKKTITVAGDTSGTWLYGPGQRGMRVRWSVLGGSTYQTTAGSWAAGDYRCSSSQANGASAGSSNFKIALPQLEVGASATAFEDLPQQAHLALLTSMNFVVDGNLPGYASSTTNAYFFLQTPQLGQYGPMGWTATVVGTQANYGVYQAGTQVGTTSAVSAGTGDGTVMLTVTGSSMTTGQSYRLSFGTNERIFVSAEFTP